VGFRGPSTNNNTGKQVMRDEEVREAFRDFVLDILSFSFTGKVEAVDEENLTATVIHGDLSYTANFKSIQDSKSEGVWIIPAVGSDVFCVPEGQSKERFIIVKYSKIDRIYFEVGETKCDVTTEHVKFNNGENGGLAKLTELETKLNDFVGKFNNHVHSGVVIAVKGGSGSPAVGTAGNSGKPTGNADTFNKSVFENTKILH
jgi:hydrogenase maturation factor